MRRLAPFLLALAAGLGLPHPTTLADPVGDTAPSGGSSPAAAAAALEATLDELEVWVQRLSRRAGAPAAGATAAGEAPRRELTAARARLAELETARAEDAATIAALRAELEASRTEAQALREQLAASRRGLERLNALLGAATAAGPLAAGGVEGGDRGTDARATGARGTPPAPPAPPTVDGGGDAASAAEGAARYAATQPVRLRAAPRNTAEVLTVVGAGAVVRRLGRDGGWLRVAYTDPFAREFTGWVHSNFLRTVEAPPDGRGDGHGGGEGMPPVAGASASREGES